MTTNSVPSIHAHCEECGLEIVFTILFKPEHRELSPVCPICRFPMTKEKTAAELVAEMKIKLDREMRTFQETLREVRI